MLTSLGFRVIVGAMAPSRQFALLQGALQSRETGRTLTAHMLPSIAKVKRARHPFGRARTRPCPRATVNAETAAAQAPMCTWLCNCSRPLAVISE